MAFKDTKDSAYVVGQVWAERGPDSFLLDQVRGKLDFVKTLDAVRSLTKAWPQALEKLVEDKANGAAVMSTLRREMAGLVEVEPDGGKDARANAVSPACRSGNVLFPHPALFPWVVTLLDELEAFPNGDYADQVDTLTQYLNQRYNNGQVSTFLAAMRAK
jgi:predicted phage terminase large subunit-like protein